MSSGRGRGGGGDVQCEVGEDVEFAVGYGSALSDHRIGLISDINLIRVEMCTVRFARRGIIKEKNGNKSNGGLRDEKGIM